jgi:hypothetical protein
MGERSSGAAYATNTANKQAIFLRVQLWPILQKHSEDMKKRSKTEGYRKNFSRCKPSIQTKE